MEVYLGGSRKHMIWQSYDTHPPVAYVTQEQARLCHFIGHVPKNNRKPFIKEIEHVLYVPGLARNCAARLREASRIERQYHSENCKAIFGPSDSVIRQVAYHISTLGIEDKLHVVLPAYPDQPDNTHEHTGPFTILTISNKFWGRGIPLAIEVFKRLREKYGQNVRMKLVCEDVPVDYPLAEGLELIRVHQLSRDLRYKLYREANVFLVLSLMEHCVDLEAIAHGVPTVSTPTFDKGGWILPGQTGYIVDPPFSLYDESFGIKWKTWNQFQEIVKIRFERGDLSYMITEAIAHVESLMNNPDQLKKMGQAAQKLQREKHSFEARNKQIRQIYAEILSELSCFG